MNDYFDLFLSVELQPDLPDGVMHEIKAALTGRTRRLRGPGLRPAAGASR